MGGRGLKRVSGLGDSHYGHVETVLKHTRKVLGETGSNCLIALIIQCKRRRRQRRYSNIAHAKVHLCKCAPSDQIKNFTEFQELQELCESCTNGTKRNETKRMANALAIIKILKHTFQVSCALICIKTHTTHAHPCR